MKKLLAIMLSFVMVFSLASCGGGSQTEESSEPDVQTIADRPTYLDYYDEELLYPGKTKDFKYNVYENHVDIISYIGDPNKEVLTVPGTIEDLPVVNVGDEVAYTGGLSDFSGKKVIFEEGILNITKMYFDTVEEIVLPSTLADAYEAFSGSSSLRKVTIKEGMTTIDYRMFFACTELEEVILPSTITEVYEEAFAGCDSLKTIKLNEGIQLIEKQAFAADGLTSINIPGTVTEIEDLAFAGSKIKTLKLPKSVQTAGTGICAECYNLTDIWIYNPELNKEKFDSDDPLASIITSQDVNGHDVTIHGAKKSTAGKMAGMGGLSFEVIKE